jgi:hypothetical protein
MSTSADPAEQHRPVDGSQAARPAKGDRASSNGGQPPTPAPPVLIGDRQLSSSWREHALTRIRELSMEATWLRPRSSDDGAGEIIAAVDQHLAAARKAVESHSLPAMMTGAAVERTINNLDAAEADLLRLAPLDYVRGSWPACWRTCAPTSRRTTRGGVKPSRSRQAENS